LARRLRAARTTIRDRRVHVTDLEHHLGTAYTAETVTLLRARCPRARFVWLMGADNLASFHRWRDWRVIAETMPLGVLARPGEQLRAGLSPAARALSFARISQSASGSLATGPAPRWCMLTGPMVGQSSSAIRAAGRWTP
jgi:nicotinate-nucleotide adenylyltransferase